MLGDALGSVAIVAGAIVIRYTGWERVDPALSILIGILIVWTAWDIIREALNILLEVSRGHPLSRRGCRHASCRGRTRCPRSAHLEPRFEHPRAQLPRADCGRSTLGERRHAAKAEYMLAGRFHISHTTVQFEHASCAISECGCAIPRRWKATRGTPAFRYRQPAPAPVTSAKAGPRR